MSSSLDAIRKLSQQAFEDSIAEIYRAEGYLVEHSADGRADDGYDLVLPNMLYGKTLFSLAPERRPGETAPVALMPTL